mmetsp:Transcript_2438/g.7458  ORF Transcript_2438/g.7458 Transcript_2438/m.7458 type:complete len:215 (-) Transcript_2438:85-729(-)
MYSQRRHARHRRHRALEPQHQAQGELPPPRPRPVGFRLWLSRALLGRHLGGPPVRSRGRAHLVGQRRHILDPRAAGRVPQADHLLPQPAQRRRQGDVVPARRAQGRPARRGRHQGAAARGAGARRGARRGGRVLRLRSGASPRDTPARKPPLSDGKGPSPPPARRQRGGARRGWAAGWARPRPTLVLMAEVAARAGVAASAHGPRCATRGDIET